LTVVVADCLSDCLTSLAWERFRRFITVTSAHRIVHLAGGDGNLQRNCECDLSVSISIRSNYPGLSAVCRSFHSVAADVPFSTDYQRRRRLRRGIIYHVCTWCSGDLQKTTCCSRRVGLRTGGRYITPDTQSETDGRMTEPAGALLESSIPPDSLLSIKSAETCLRLVLSADKKQMAESLVQRSTGDKIKARREAGDVRAKKVTSRNKRSRLKVQ